MGNARYCDICGGVHNWNIHTFNTGKQGDKDIKPGSLIVWDICNKCQAEIIEYLYKSEKKLTQPILEELRKKKYKFAHDVLEDKEENNDQK